MKKNQTDVLYENGILKITMLDYSKSVGKQVYVDQCEKYITDLRHMKFCSRWGIFYSHDAETKCRSVTQEEFDAYTYHCESTGCLTECCNGTVHSIKLFLYGYQTSKQKDWKVTTFSLKSMLNDDAFLSYVLQFDYDEEKGNVVCNKEPCTELQAKEFGAKEIDRQEMSKKSKSRKRRLEF